MKYFKTKLFNEKNSNNKKSNFEYMEWKAIIKTMKWTFLTNSNKVKILQYWCKKTLNGPLLYIVWRQNKQQFFFTSKNFQHKYLTIKKEYLNGDLINRFTSRFMFNVKASLMLIKKCWVEKPFFRLSVRLFE